VCVFAYPQEIFPLSGQAIALAYNPDAWVVGPGGCFGFFGIGDAGLGVAAEGVITFAVANNETSPAMEDLFNNFLAGGDPAGQDFWGHPVYYSALQIWQHAVAQVGQVQDGGFIIDQDDLKDELASYNSAGSAVTTVLGDTWYTMFGTGGGILAYQCHTGEIGQWQGGYIEIIAGTQCVNEEGTGLETLSTYLPNYVTTGTIDYPKDPWPAGP